ncbi:uncharacterized protein LOC144434421 [Glandiceps talaboti]
MQKFGYITFVLGIVAGVFLVLMLNQYEHLFMSTIAMETPVKVLNALFSPNTDSHPGKYESSYFYVRNGTKLKIAESELARKVKEEYFDPRNQKDMLYNDVRLLCLVHIEKDVSKLSKALHETWASHCNKVVIISSSTDQSVQDLHHIDVANKAELTWERSKQSLRHAMDKYRKDFDWFLKVEVDTFVVPENIRYLVLVHNSSVPGYIGHVFLGDKGGSAFVISRQGLEIISPQLQNCPAKEGGRKDDVELTQCFNKVGVMSSTHGIDHKGELRFEMKIPDHKLPSNTLAAIGFSGRYWRYIKYPEKKGPECCYEYAITYHNVNHHMLYILEHLVYHLRPYGVGVTLDPCKAEEGQKQIPQTEGNEQQIKDKEKLNEVKKEEPKKEQNAIIPKEGETKLKEEPKKEDNVIPKEEEKGEEPKKKQGEVRKESEKGVEVKKEEPREDTPAKILKDKVRVFVWVATHPGSKEKRLKHVKATWAKRFDNLLFMSSEEDKDFPIVGLTLGVPDSRNTQWAKTRAAFTYLYENHFDDADWFMKADDDTYVVAENVLHFLSDKDPSQPQYYGKRLIPFVKGGYNSGGSGYILSKEALRILITQAYNNPAKCRGIEAVHEDLQTAHCLAGVGVYPGNSLDSQGRERFHHFPPDYMFVPGTFSGKGKLSWFKKYCYYQTPEGPGCCSDYTITFHRLRSDWMYALDYMIYDMRPFGVEMSVCPYTNNNTA